MRILVVEDDVNLNRQLSDTLKEAGYVVDQAFDGEEGHFPMTPSSSISAFPRWMA